MRPLRGVVVADGVVRCENGLTATAVLPPTVKRYEAVWVFFDFVNGAIKEVTPLRNAEETTMELSEDTQSDECPVFEENDFMEVEEHYEDSEALEPPSDYDEFWDSEL